jgi:hypothetical protein
MSLTSLLANIAMDNTTCTLDRSPKVGLIGFEQHPKLVNLRIVRLLHPRNQALSNGYGEDQTEFLPLYTPEL